MKIEVGTKLYRVHNSYGGGSPRVCCATVTYASESQIRITTPNMNDASGFGYRTRLNPRLMGQYALTREAAIDGYVKECAEKLSHAQRTFDAAQALKS